VIASRVLVGMLQFGVFPHMIYDANPPYDFRVNLFSFFAQDRPGRLLESRLRISSFNAQNL